MFVVCKQTYSYNDETYNKEDGGIPIQTFTSRKKAEAYLEIETKNWLLKNNVGEYSYEKDDLFNKCVHHLVSDEYEFCIGEQPPEVQDLLIKNCLVKPFVLYEVP